MTILSPYVAGMTVSSFRDPHLLCPSGGLPQDDIELAAT
jgi:hypothetical protein